MIFVARFLIYFIDFEKVLIMSSNSELQKQQIEHNQSVLDTKIWTNCVQQSTNLNISFATDKD